jgi:hypothetical protein
LRFATLVAHAPPPTGGTLADIIEPTTPLLTIGGSLEPRRMTLDEIHRVVKTTLFSRTMTDEKRSPVR